MSWNKTGAGQAGAMGIEYLDGLYSYAMVLTCSFDRYNQAVSALQRDNLVLGWFRQSC
jgi:hypothetical protein